MSWRSRPCGRPLPRAWGPRPAPADVGALGVASVGLSLEGL